MTLRDRLVGAWVLESYEAHGPDGTVHEPFGSEPAGLLVYGADGRMAVQVMDPRRPRWAREATDEQRRAERAAAADGYIACAGRFEVEDGGAALAEHLGRDPTEEELTRLLDAVWRRRAGDAGHSAR
jgi:lipocalin-like protein